jgi:hypothetical protein
MNATIAETSALNRVAAARTRDRRVAILIAVIFPLIVLIGFARSYYLKGVFGFPPLPNRLVHIHGLIMTSWVVLFVVQVGLVASHRTKMHMKLGILGSVLALLVFVVGMLTGIDGAARGSSVPGIPPLNFLIIPLGDMVVFAALVGAALYYRRKFDIHKRLMLLSAFNFLPAAVARIPLGFIQSGGPLAFYGIPDLFVVAFIAYDTIKNRRLHPAALCGGLLIIASHPLRIMFAGTTTWVSIAQSLVALAR